MLASTALVVALVMVGASAAGLGVDTVTDTEDYWLARSTVESTVPMSATVIQMLPEASYEMPNPCFKAGSMEEAEWISAGTVSSLTVPPNTLYMVYGDLYVTNNLYVEGGLLLQGTLRVDGTTYVASQGIIATADGSQPASPLAAPWVVGSVGAGHLVLTGTIDIDGTLVTGHGLTPDTDSGSKTGSFPDAQTFTGAPGRDGGSIVVDSPTGSVGVQNACIATGAGSNGASPPVDPILLNVGGTTAVGGAGGIGGDFILLMNGFPWNALIHSSTRICIGGGGHGADSVYSSAGSGAMAAVGGGGGRSGWVRSPDNLALSWNDVSGNVYSCGGPYSPSGGNGGYAQPTKSRFGANVPLDVLPTLPIQQSSAQSSSSDDGPPDAGTDPVGWALYWIDFFTALPPIPGWCGTTGCGPQDPPTVEPCTDGTVAEGGTTSGTPGLAGRIENDHEQNVTKELHYYRFNGTDANGSTEKGEDGEAPKPMKAWGGDGGDGLFVGGRGGDAEATGCRGAQGGKGGDGLPGGDAPFYNPPEDCETYHVKFEQMSGSATEYTTFTKTGLDFTVAWAHRYGIEVEAFIKLTGRPPQTAAEIESLAVKAMEEVERSMAVTMHAERGNSVSTEVTSATAQSVEYDVRVCAKHVVYVGMGGDGLQSGEGGKGGDGGLGYAKGGDGGDGFIRGGDGGIGTGTGGMGGDGGDAGASGTGGTGCQPGRTLGNKGGAVGGPGEGDGEGGAGGTSFLPAAPIWTPVPGAMSGTPGPGLDNPGSSGKNPGFTTPSGYGVNDCNAAYAFAIVVQNPGRTVLKGP